MSLLLPCPLCGGEALGIDHPPHKHVIATFMPDHPGSYSIECVKCSLGLLEPTKVQAETLWNRRTSVPEAACIELLRAARCPNKDCESGAIPYFRSSGDLDWEQCQWCDERKKLVETIPSPQLRLCGCPGACQGYATLSKGVTCAMHVPESIARPPQGESK